MRRVIDDFSIKVVYYDHLKGQFQGVAHDDCNLYYKNQRFIWIIFHNFSGSDANLLIRQFGQNDGDIKLIPNTEGKCIWFSKIARYDSDRKI